MSRNRFPMGGWCPRKRSKPDKQESEGHDSLGGHDSLDMYLESFGHDSLDKCPESLVQYFADAAASHECSSNEPPLKRQRMDGENNPGHMVVKRSSIVLKFRQPTQRKTTTSLRYKSYTAYTRIDSTPNGVQLRIYDEKKDYIYFGGYSKVLDGLFDIENVDTEAIGMTEMVRRDAKDLHNPKVHGRLWAETEFELSTQEGFDVLLVTWSIKWSFTFSLRYLPRKRPRRYLLDRLLARYFPNPDFKQNASNISTPEEFYNSVHVPSKDDPIAASLETPELATELYPFQKRAVRWLLEREGVQWSKEKKAVEKMTSTVEFSSQSFYQVVDEDGRTCWVNPVLNIVTDDITPFETVQNELKGGLLVEEMGLGKTLEIIALISLHKYPWDDLPVRIDPYTAQQVRPIGATLIITPPSILQQWESELARHAPTLKVFHYEGIKKYKRFDESQLLEKIATQDVVLTTYRVLAAEIHYAVPPPTRKLRRESTHQRPISPLMYFSWWRCILDEAQMIENGVTNAATVARLIPRKNAWGVTGTPVKKDAEDLLGLLLFLRYDPYASVSWTWEFLITKHKPAFQVLFKRIALRHTKRLVRDELRLPPQKRFVITMPFTPIEEQYYQSLFQEMCDACGVDPQGAPLTDYWDPNSPLIVERMRRWLARLRQSALHPEIGVDNRRALGRKDGPLRTVDQVLETMLEQTESNIRSDQRSLLISRIKRGQLFENSPRVKEALAIWKHVIEDANAIVFECRQQLQRQIEALKVDRLAASKSINKEVSSDDESSDDDSEADDEASTRIGILQNRLNSILEVQHVAVFFSANAYFQIKSNEEMTKPGSDEFKELEKLETEGYQHAKRVRQEILKEILEKNNRPMKRLAKKASSEDFATIPEFITEEPKGGIESRRILEQLGELAGVLDAQANQLDDWRETTIRHLLKPLVDNEDMDATGEEYEQSTKTQEEVVVYVQALRAAIEDRHDALSGQENQLVKYETLAALKLAGNEKGAFPEKTLELLSIRDRLKPPKQLGSVRGILSDLRILSTRLRNDAANGNSRAENELALVEQQMKMVQKHFSEQNKATASLRQEIDEYTSLMNLRVEYYRQLQRVSDMVAPLPEDHPPNLERTLLEAEKKLTSKIASLSSKRRYLLHLQEESSIGHEERVCVICETSFENGSLTVCGHIFCKDCMGLWWRAHRNCPVCKRKLTLDDLHDITYKPQELKMAEEATSVALENQERTLEATSKKSAIYSQIGNDILEQIKNIDLNGFSFTTKVDTLCRHLLWIRESDPGAKSIIFSQFKEFLDVLGQAFQHHRIGYSTIDKPGGIEKFKEDAGTECFLLHAKSQSSGLNLVNASHVFLCEPLINTALELQAIARVDRIGQEQATTVWLYLVDGTVEESIYDISVRRRMEHMGRSSKGKSKESTPELLDSSIEVANSLELQQAGLSSLLTKEKAGGEMVEKGDLWECLFGNRRERGVNGRLNGANEAVGEQVEREVARHFGAEAAEQRMIEEL